MKKVFTLLLMAVLFFSVSMVNAQRSKGSSSVIPYKSGLSPQYGTDIIINNDPLQDQRNAHVSVAFNGWLYACYTIATGGFQVAKSTDDGVTWTYSAIIWPDYTFPKVDLIVVGKTVADLRVWVGYICYYTTATNDWDAGYEILDGDVNDLTYADMDATTSDFYYDVAIASDYKYLSYGITDPNYSIGLLYSKANSSADTLLCFTTSDAGTTFHPRQVVTTTYNYLRNVSLSYGISMTYWDGRYFAAWEERNNAAFDLGEILTAHTASWIYDPFTIPVRLDNLFAYGDHYCKNPSITCMQTTTADNDSTNITQLVTFDVLYSSAPDFDIASAACMQPLSDSYFVPNTIIGSTNNEIQSNVSYDPGYDNFLLTYYDSTAQKLPYYVNNRNLSTGWIQISSGYNGNTNLAAPYPKVQINPVQLRVAHVWNAEGAGVGVAMYDAEYSTYTGVSSNSQASGVSLGGASPNPCNSGTHINFTLVQSTKVTITLYSVFGESIATLADESFPQGRNKVNVNTGNLPSGSYIYKFRTNGFTGSGRIEVIH